MAIISSANTLVAAFRLGLTRDAVRRAHAAAREFHASYPGIPVEVSVHAEHDADLIAADPLSPPVLIIIMDGYGPSVSQPIGSTVPTILDAMKREWLSATADEATADPARPHGPRQAGIDG